MKKTTSFFFSKILYKDIHNISGAYIGALNDLILDFKTDKPTVRAIEIKNGRGLSYISADSLEVYKSKGNSYYVKVNSNELSVRDSDGNDIFLARDFLDKQIVDIDGRKVVRVNDARMGIIKGEWKVVAVDIGFRGLMRRLGVEGVVETLCKFVKINFHNALIIWDSVQPLATGVENLRLSTSLSRIQMLHAADIADIIEELDRKSGDALFQSLNNEKAAEVLEEIESDVQISLIENLPDEKVSDILEIMPSDEAADILEEIEDSRVERLLVQMDQESSVEIRELMEYKDLTVGSIMTKDYISFLPDVKISDAINMIREEKPKGDIANNFFVVNNKNKLIGMVLPIDLLTPEADLKLYDVMITNSISVQDMDGIDEALEIMQKYNLVSIPVVDEEGELIGMTSLNDLVYEYIRLRRVAA